MTYEMITSSFINFKLSRQVKRPHTDEFKILHALPDDIAESTWADLLHKEELELMILGVREDILDLAMEVCYGRYMERQKFAFTAHCAAEAWLQIIDWHYFRHDPGEDPSAYPPADIPNREESWIPDEIPEPSPKDTWCKRDLEVELQQEDICCCTDQVEEQEDGIDEVASGSCACESNVMESSPCVCSDTRDSQAVVSTSRDSIPIMDSSPNVPASSECGAGDSRSSETSKRRHKNIFSQSTSGRSKQTLPPLKKSSKTRRS